MGTDNDAFQVGDFHLSRVGFIHPFLFEEESNALLNHDNPGPYVKYQLWIAAQNFIAGRSQEVAKVAARFVAKDIKVLDAPDDDLLVVLLEFVVVGGDYARILVPKGWLFPDARAAVLERAGEIFARHGMRTETVLAEPLIRLDVPKRVVLRWRLIRLNVSCIGVFSWTKRPVSDMWCFESHVEFGRDVDRRKSRSLLAKRLGHVIADENFLVD